MTTKIIWINKDNINEDDLINYVATESKIMEITQRSIILSFGEKYVIKVPFGSNYNEIDTLVKFQGHENIIRLNCIMRNDKLISDIQQIVNKRNECVDIWTYLFVMEKGIDIKRDYLFKNFRINIVQMLLALEYIHTYGYIHCDVKYNNFITIDDNIKLIDFDSCVKMNKISEGKYINYESTYVYPFAKATSKIDIWCLFISILDILFGKVNFKYEINDIMCGGFFSSKSIEWKIDHAKEPFTKYVNWKFKLYKQKNSDTFVLGDDVMELILKNVKFDGVMTATEILNLSLFDNYRDLINVTREKNKLPIINTFQYKTTNFYKLEKKIFKTEEINNEMFLKLVDNIYQRYLVKSDKIYENNIVYISIIFLCIKYLCNVSVYSIDDFINNFVNWIGLDDTSKQFIIENYEEIEFDVISKLECNVFFEDVMFT